MQPYPFLAMFTRPYSCGAIYAKIHNYDKEVESVLNCLKLALYAIEKLEALEREIGIDLCVTYYEPSLAILFRSPNSKIAVKYLLPTQVLCIDGQDRFYTHIYIMKHVTIQLVDSIIKDLQTKDSFSCEV